MEDEKLRFTNGPIELLANPEQVKHFGVGAIYERIMDGPRKNTFSRTYQVMFRATGYLENEPRLEERKTPAPPSLLDFDSFLTDKGIYLAHSRLKFTDSPKVVNHGTKTEFYVIGTAEVYSLATDSLVEKTSRSEVPDFLPPGI